MKTVKLNITGGRNDKMAQFYNCGKEGDELYAKAQELMEENDASAVKDFIEKDFENEDVGLFVHGLDEHGHINVWVEDEDGKTVFSDEECNATTQRGFILIDPRKWEYDESMGDRLTKTIKKFIEESNDGIESALKLLGDAELDESFVDDDEHLCDFADGVREIIVQSPFIEAGYEIDSYYLKTCFKSPPLLFVTRCTELYGTGAMSCEIKLADDEDFDINKLKIILHDYDGFYRDCQDSALPVVLYNNKFYRLDRESWESKYDYYGFASKDEGGSDFDFSDMEVTGDVELFAPMDDLLRRIAQSYRELYAEAEQNGEEEDTNKLDNDILGYIGDLDLDSLEKVASCTRERDGLYINPKRTYDFALVEDGKVVIEYDSCFDDDEDDEIEDE